MPFCCTRLQTTAQTSRSNLHDNGYPVDSELRRRAANTQGNTVTAARESPVGEGGRNGGTISPSRIGAATAAASNTSRWTAGKILTTGDSNRNGDSDSDRHWVPSGVAPATSTAETPRQQRGILGMNGGNGSSQNDTNHHGSRAGLSNGRGVLSGRRARSGATWGLIGGWGDSFANTTDTGENKNSTNNNNNNIGTVNEPRGVSELAQPSVSYGYTHHENRGGNPKNESATAPWAAVQAAGVNVFKLSTGQAALMARKSAGTPRRADVGTGKKTCSTGRLRYNQRIFERNCGLTSRARSQPVGRAEGKTQVHLDEFWCSSCIQTGISNESSVNNLW